MPWRQAVLFVCPARWQRGQIKWRHGRLCEQYMFLLAFSCRLPRVLLRVSFTNVPKYPIVEDVALLVFKPGVLAVFLGYSPQRLRPFVTRGVFVAMLL